MNLPSSRNHDAEDPTTCFLSSGSPRFDSEGLTALEVRSQSVGVDYGIIQLNGERAAFVRTSESEAWLKVWEHPRVGCRYLLAVDPIEHIEGEGGGADKDCTSAQVWRADYLDEQQRRWPPRLVARIKPPWRGDNSVTAKMLMQMSKFYGDCIVVVETNVGVGLVDHLKRMEVNLYIEERLDLISQKFTRKVGWRTTAENRDTPIDALGDACRENRVDIGCPHVVGEMRTFVRNSKGRAEAASGRHDDDVMAAGIALYTLPHATLITESTRKARRPADHDQWEPIN